MLTHLTVWLIALNPMTKYGIMMNPVNNQIEGFLAISGNAKYASRFLVSLSAVSVSILVPSFTKVMGLLGSCFSIGIAVIFPVSCYLHQNWAALGSLSRAGHALLLIVALCTSVFGTCCILVY